MKMYEYCKSEKELNEKIKNEGGYSTESMIESFKEQGLEYTDMLKTFWAILFDDEGLEQQALETGWTVDHIRRGFLNLVDYIINECL